MFERMQFTMKVPISVPPVVELTQQGIEFLIYLSNHHKRTA